VVQGRHGIPDNENVPTSGLVLDAIQAESRSMAPDDIGGKFFHVAALNTDIVLNFTTEMGGCSGLYWAYVFQMPKWAYNVAKVDEWMEASPAHTDTYNLLVGQRQRIEGQIKQGLQSAAQAVTDYELIAHDARRYREILDYFRDEKKRGDEHVLRSLFVDRVDAHTGEGYSMITMAKRWPTIITDFIRMGQEKYIEDKVEWSIENIEKKLDVTQAEATVLRTKNNMFQQWKKMFRPTVAERYARIQAMAGARKKSIDDYKTWLRPYVVRHKMMKEIGENTSSHSVNSSFFTPGFGSQTSMSNVRLWVWKSFPIGEKRKPDAQLSTITDSKGKNGVGWMIDPLDDFVRKWAKRIEYRYGLRPGTYDDDDIRKLLGDPVNGWATKFSPHQAEGAVMKMVPTELYYVLFDININKAIVKVPPPAGGEAEDITLDPLRTWICSQNVMLVHLLELDAREKAFENELDEMLGTRNVENDFLDRSKRLLKGQDWEKEEKTAKANAARRFTSRISRGYGRCRGWSSNNISRYFIRPGPYESVFYERVVKMYLVEVGGLYGQQVNFWKSKAGVG